MYLQRRTGGVYYFRMSIPTRLTAAYERRESVFLLFYGPSQCQAECRNIRGRIILCICFADMIAEKRSAGKKREENERLFSSLYSMHGDRNQFFRL